MKTRRGFFTAIVGAVAAPLALKLFPKRDNGLAQRKWLFNPACEIDPKYLTGLFTAPWPPPYTINLVDPASKTFEADLDAGTVTITEYIRVGEAAKRYPVYVFYPEEPLTFTLGNGPINVATNQGEQNS